MIERRLNRSATTPESEPKITLGRKRATNKRPICAAGAPQLKNDRVKGNRVKPIPHLAHNLAQPHLTEAAVAAKQFDVTCGTTMVGVLFVNFVTRTKVSTDQ